MPKTSLASSDVTLNDDNSCVVLFCYKHHALIGLERFINGDHTIYVMDFLPARGQQVFLNWDGITQNELFDGHVRIQQFDLDGVTRQDLFSTLNLEDGFKRNYKSQKCTTSQAESLLSLVRTSQDNPPKFQPAGNYRSDSTGHNCITWAETHLSSAGIKIRANITAQTYDSVVAVPEKHIETTSSGGCRLF